MTISPVNVLKKCVPKIDFSSLPSAEVNSLASAVLILGRRKNNAIPDFDGDIRSFKDKVDAYNIALNENIFFNVQMGSEGGLLIVRDNNSVKSNKNVSLHFDLDWKVVGDIEVTSIKFGDIERKIYPELTGRVQSLEVVDTRKSGSSKGLTHNQVNITGPIAEKMLLIATASGSDMTAIDEIRNARLSYSPKKELNAELAR